MEFGEDSDRMSRFFADYPLKLFCVNENTDFAVFHTELREVFEALKFRRDKKGFRRIIENNPAYGNLDRDTVEVLSVLMQAPRIWEEREKYMNHNNENEEGYDMITAWQELLTDERAEGRMEAQAAIILNMIKRGFSEEDICSLAECDLKKVAEVRNKMGCKL